MNSKSTAMFQVSVLMTFLLCINSFAQENNTPTNAEIKNEVPELTRFHEVIYKIWHIAWPKKDVAMLKGLLPEVEQQGGDLCKAELSGILREKKDSWAIGVDTMRSILDKYKRAANDGDSKSLLEAAEQLHRQYEQMVRLIRPALKELNDFHSVLYPLYHYLKPQKDLEKTKLAVAGLMEKMQALERATLPIRLKEKDIAFGEARKGLAAAVNSLHASLSGNDWAVIDRGIDAVHERYEEVSRLFD